MTMLIRAGVSPSSLLPAVRAVIRSVDPTAPVTRAERLSTIVESSLARRRFALKLLGTFAALAMLLTAIGVYGVISYAVSRRRREFAIRFALGAERTDLRRLIFGNFTAPGIVGLIAGLGLAQLFAGLLRTQLYKLSPFDPIVLAASAATLLCIVLASALRPAMKAASVPAAAALRE
jgi:ABC-type antimicrobial peptide transport system permease subunit